jgi:DNA-binding response OmpR family regulator
MKINSINEEKLILDFFTKKVLEINGITEEDIDKADKLDLLYDNIKLKSENVELISRVNTFEKRFTENAIYAEIPRLIINEKLHEYTFILNGIEKKAQFNPKTNEYRILYYFINHPFIPCSYKVLEKELKKERQGANYLSKRRVKDFIKVIRSKLGNDSIVNYIEQSYLFAASVSYI